MRSTSTTARKALIALLVVVNVLAGTSDAVFTGRQVFLRRARIEETAALFANSTPNTEILHEPIQKAAESALVARMDNSLQVANDRAWVPPGLERRTFYSVALDYFEKEGEINASTNATAYWVRDPGQINFLLLDKSPEHISLHRVFRAAAVLATASVFTRPRDKMVAEKYQYEATAILDPVFMSEDSMRPGMTWAAAIPKDAQENADSLQPNPNGFMELNDLPLMLDVVSMLQVDDDQTSRLEQWLREYRTWLETWRSRNIDRFSPEGELSMHLQLATISHFLGNITEYHAHCDGTENIFRSWIGVDGHLTTLIRATTPVESTLESLKALTTLALVCDASPTDLFHLPAPDADDTTRPLLALAAKRAADQFAGHQLHIPTDDKFPTYGHPHGLSFYSAIETLPALYQAYGQKEVAYFMKGIVADNEEEHRSGRALVASLRHVPPTSPANINFLTDTANSGEYSCGAREVLGLTQCKPVDFVHTKAGIAVLTIVCVFVAIGLCMVIRWRRGLAREDPLPEYLPSPRPIAATAHVKVTLKEKTGKGSVKGTGEKGKECNSGSMGGSDMRIGSLPAGSAGTGNIGTYAGTPQPHAWRNNPMRNSDSFMTSSHRSITGSHMHGAGGTSSLGGGASSFIHPGTPIPPTLQWQNGATVPMPGAHSPTNLYYNPVAAAVPAPGHMPVHATHGVVPAVAPMPSGYGTGMPTNGQAPGTSYFPNLGVFLPNRRRSRSRTPPRGRSQHRAPGPAHTSPHGSARNSQSRDQLMESLTAFQKVTKATTAPFSKSRTGTASSSADGTEARSQRIAAGSLLADAKPPQDMKNECSVDDVPMQPRAHQHGMTGEGSESSVAHGGSVSFALANAACPNSNNQNKKSDSQALAAKIQAAAPAVDGESSFGTCCTHATFATGISAIAEERSRDVAGGASSFFKDCHEPVEAVFSVSPSQLQIPGHNQNLYEDGLSPVMSPEGTIARSMRSGRDVATSDVEDDASVLSVVVSHAQSNMGVCKSPEGHGRFSLRSPSRSVRSASMSPDKMEKVEKVDTFTEAAPSVALLQASASVTRTPPKPKQLRPGAAASPGPSPGGVSDLDDTISCMHMPPPPTGPTGGVASGFFETATMGGGGKSPEKEGLAAMMPQVLQDTAAAERRKRMRKIAAEGDVSRKAAAENQKNSTTQTRPGLAAPEITACETEFELAERAQQAREELSGMLRDCNKKP